MHSADSTSRAGFLRPMEPLVYEGQTIGDREEALSLTDMWKAAGSPANQDPAQWLRSAQGEAFIDAVSVNMGISHNDLVQAVRGGKRPGTWAHWQIAFAYAKYLSPDFHMWCNQVVRSHMEARHTTPATAFADLKAVREHRLLFQHNVKLLTLAGVKGAEAVIAANQATTRATGFDTLEAMGVKHLVAPQNDMLIVPSDIGSALGISAIKVNDALRAHGFQEGKRDRNDKGYWVPTDKGTRYGGTVVIVQRGNDVTGSARQLKWPSAMIEVVRDLLDGEGK